jgi:hypothetical protein
MGHISFWPRLMMIIFWGKNRYHTVKPQTLLDASKEVCLELNPEKT